MAKGFMLCDGVQAVGACTFDLEAELPLIGVGQCEVLRDVKCRKHKKDV